MWHANLSDETGVHDRIARHLAVVPSGACPVAVLDIDDSVLLSEELRPNPMVQRVLRELLRDIPVAYITARSDSPVARMWTRMQLHMLGAPRGVALHLMPRDQYALSREGVRAFKHDRRAALEEQGYTIVLNVGDQWTDFDEVPHAASKAPCAYYGWHPTAHTLALKLPHRVLR